MLRTFVLLLLVIRLVFGDSKSENVKKILYKNRKQYDAVITSSSVAFCQRAVVSVARQVTAKSD